MKILREYEVVFKGQLVKVKVVAPVLVPLDKLSITKARYSRCRSSGGMYIARERGLKINRLNKVSRTKYKEEG